MAKYNSSSSKKSLIFLLVAGLLVLLFANILPKIQVYLKSSKASSLLSFPADFGPHSNFKTEWWYLNLLTRTTKTDGTNQKDLAYVISFSRVLGNKGLLSSRYDNSTKSFNQNISTGGDLQTYLVDQKYLFTQYTNGQNYATLQEQAPGPDRKRVYKLTGKTDQMGSFNLQLKERTIPITGQTTPLLWGGITGNCQGRISVFAPNDTYYYSIPDLDITGTITDIDGVIRNVSVGKAWVDHQWFDTKPPIDWKGHYWTSFHFTESNNLYDANPHHAVGFVTQIYNTGPKYTYWVKRNPNGYNQCGENASITINNYGTTNYPSSWNIKINKDNLFINTNGVPFSNNQIFQAPIGPRFVESASYYSGNVSGRPFTGLGFFETHLTR